MKSLQDFRREHGEFMYPDHMELAEVVQRIETPIVNAMSRFDTKGVKSVLIPKARMDLASQALSEAEGYQRKVTTFKDLTRAELAFVEAWLATNPVEQELTARGWLPTSDHPAGPDPKRIVALLKDDPDIAPRTRKELIERFIIT